MEMREEIGKVTLDYTRYPGRDFYCDGSVEDELLNIVKNNAPTEYARIIEEKKSWPILYHLSALRENIVDWIPMDKTDKVLEVGSGCGAITGALAAKSGQVTCVDLSKKRSLINAHRHSDCENITIHVGNFKDIEPDLETDYDYICLIGVFEYGQGYIGGDTPYIDFLKILKRHLSENGRIIIAIENQYGLKYFAGCKEDHLGTYFSGIENYVQSSGVRTFGRHGLEKIFKSCGVPEYHFYYPYPDYKFMTTIYSDAYLPGRGELSNNFRNFDRDRMLLFDEKSAFDGIVQEGLFSVFANSYLVILGKDFPVKYVKYSNDRADKYVIKTQIHRDKTASPPQVYKIPLSQEAQDHVRKMGDSYHKLVEKYQGGKLEINRCKLEETDGALRAAFEYVNGVPLSELMDDCLDRGDHEGFYKYFREYVDRIGYNSSYPITDYDLVFGNILVNGDQWTLIDYEWVSDKPIAVKELAFRALYCFLLEDERRGKLDLKPVLAELGITEQETCAFCEKEMEFQKLVTGQKRSMAELRELLGSRMMVPQKWIERIRDNEDCNRVQIYEDMGQGYREDQSYFVKEGFQNENLVELNLNVSNQVKTLRIDPCMDSCVVKIVKMTLNGVVIPLRNRRVLITNGRAVKASDKETLSIVFATRDPNINIRMERLNPREENLLSVKLEVVRLPLETAKEMAQGMRRWF